MSSSTHYLVQKCWFEGPHVTPAMDYLRLFQTAGAAERFAAHSAHTFSMGSTKPVRTLFLQDTKSYAFLASGQLFWIRAVQVVGMVTAAGAHAVVTEGVIGGHGGRRGREVCHGRIFAGTDSAAAALQVSQELAKQAASRQPSRSWITWLPIGDVPFEMLPPWPDQEQWTNTSFDGNEGTWKRHLESAREWGREIAAGTDEDIRESKRQCRMPQSALAPMTSSPQPMTW